MSFKKVGFLGIVLFLMSQCSSHPAKGIDDTSYLVSYDAASDTILEDGLKIAYIGNMGVLIEVGEKTVLIDGLHQFYKKAYVHPSDEVVEQLITGTFPNFSPIEYCLFTHRHGDHFSGELSARYLNQNKEGQIAGASQIKDGIHQFYTDGDGATSRINVIPSDRLPYNLKNSNISITAIRCDHSNPTSHGNTQNIAYIAQLGNYKVLHVGDTDWDLTEAPFEALNITNQAIDIAILPYWMILEMRAVSIVKQVIAPKHIIATHIPPDFSDRQQVALKRRFENLTLFVDQGEVWGSR